MKGQNGNLLKNLNGRQAAGGAFTLSAIVPSVLSFLFLLTITALGLTKNEGYTNKDWYLYASYLITPIAFILVFVLFFRLTKREVGDVLGKCSGKYFAIAFLLQFGLFSLSELNTVFLKFLSRFGYESTPLVLPSVWDAKIVGVILVVAVLPAITEELMFRGVVLGGLKEYGTAFSVLVSGALFALYHQNPAQTAYQFVCGAAFALVAVKSGSVLPTVLSHFFNNAVILVLFRVGLAAFPVYVRIPFLIVSALALVGSVVYLIFFDKNGKSEGEKPPKKDFFLYAAAGIFILAISWLSNFVAGV